MRGFIFLLLLGLLAPAGSSAARDLFHATVTGADGEVLAQDGRSDLPRLVRDVVQRRGAFAALAGQEAEARIDYAGAADAIVLHLDEAGETVSLRLLNLEGGRRAFHAVHGPLDRQVEDFLLREAGDAQAEFRRTLNLLSPVAVVDGNPRATTAFMAESAFRRHAYSPGWLLSAPDVEPVRGWFNRYDLYGGTYSTNGLGGDFIAGSVTTGYRFSEKTALEVAVPAQYRRVEGADVFDLGLEVGVPLRIVTCVEGERNWTVTPFALAAGAYSSDMAAGGLLWGGGVSNSIAHQHGRFTFIIGNQIAFFNGEPLRIGDNRLETNLRQQLLKNGLKVGYDVSRDLTIDASTTYTNFIQPEAWLRNYWTWSFGASYRLGERAGIRGEYSLDSKGGYRGQTGRLTLYFGW